MFTILCAKKRDVISKFLFYCKNKRAYHVRKFSKFNLNLIYLQELLKIKNTETRNKQNPYKKGNFFQLTRRENVFHIFM